MNCEPNFESCLGVHLTKPLSLEELAGDGSCLRSRMEMIGGDIDD